MRPLNAREFAEQLRLEGHPFADEVMDALDSEATVDAYNELTDDLDHYAKSKGTPARQLEWIGDRSKLLAEIETALGDANRVRDVDDEIKDMLTTLEQAEALLMQSRWLSEGGDLISALESVLGCAKPQEYDL